jgi:hypothetical protein
LEGHASISTAGGSVNLCSEVNPMPQVTDNSTLSDRHYITLILRLTLDQTGTLIRGDLVDTISAHPEHFIGATGLHQAVETWLRRQHSKDDEGNNTPNDIS